MKYLDSDRKIKPSLINFLKENQDLVKEGNFEELYNESLNTKKLEKTPVGTTFKMLVNPKNDYVVELVADDVVILDFDYAQKELERDGVGFFYLGVVMYVFAIIFIFYMHYCIV